MGYVMVEEALEVVERAVLVVEGWFTTKVEPRRFVGGGCIRRRGAS
jgi:hypothetical protein